MVSSTVYPSFALQSNPPLHNKLSSGGRPSSEDLD